MIQKVTRKKQKSPDFHLKKSGLSKIYLLFKIIS